MEDVLRYLDANPELRQLTAGTVRQEGYLKSLRDEQGSAAGSSAPGS